MILFLLFASGAYGQSFYHYENILLNQNGQPIVGVNVWVCTGNAVPLFTGNPPCALASVFSDQAGTLPITQPITTSPLGNYGFYVASPTTVTMAFSGNGISNSSDVLTIPVVSGAISTTATNLVGPGTITGTFTGTHTESGIVTFSNASSTFAGNATTATTATSATSATTATNLTGPGAITGTFSGSPTFTGTITCTIINAVPCISPSNPQGWSGADICAWITSAEASLPSTGGRVQIASGAYSACAAGFTVGRFSPAKPVLLQIDTTTIVVNAQVIVEGGSGIIGAGSNGIQIPTTIQAGSSFPTTTALIQVDKANAVQQDIKLIGFAADCGTITGCTSFDMGGAEDGTVAQEIIGYHYAAGGSAGNCMNLPNAGGGAISQLNLVINLQCYASSTSSGSTAIGMNAAADNFVFQRVTIVPLCAASNCAATGIAVTSPITAIDIHCEKTVKCIDFSGTSAQGSVIGVNLTSTDTTGVAIESTVTGSIHIQQVQTFSATNAVTNAIAGLTGIAGVGTCTDANLADYELTNGVVVRSSCGGVITMSGTSNPVAKVVGDAGANDADLQIVNTHASGHTWEIGEMFSIGHLTFRDKTQTGAPAWSLLVNGTTGFEGQLVHSITANRLWTFPDAGGQVPISPNLLISATAPTIAGAGCGGTVAAIQNANGTASFNIFTGTAPTSGGCTITMPAATTDWHCEANHVSAISTTNFIIQQTGALSTTSVTLQLFSDVAAATAPTASDTWRTTCTAN